MRQSPAPVAPKSALPSDDARKEQVGLSHRADRSLSRETLPERRNTHPKQRPELLNMSPFAWLLRRYCWTPMTPWMILLAGAVVTSLICWLAKPDEFQEIAVIAIWVLFFVHAAFKAKLGELASQGIYDEKRSGALEHILVTLVKPREIVSAHWRMLRSSFGPAMLLLILIDLAFAAGCFVQLYIGMLPEYQTEELAFLLFFWLYLPATLLMDSYVLMQVGMWEALRAKKKWSHVRGNAFAYVALLPSGIFIVFWIALLWLTDGDAASFPLFAVLWCSLSVAANLFWIRLCRPILRRRFRKIAQETATPVRLA